MYKSASTHKQIQACFALVTVFLIALLMSPAAATAAATTIVVDPQIRHQRISGWEATGRMWQFDKDNDRFNDEWEAHADAILNRLVNELGINRFRLEAMSGMENPVNYWSEFTGHRIGYRQFRNHYYEKINDNPDAFDTDPAGFQFGYMDYLVEKMLLPMKKLMENNAETLFVNLTYVDFKWTPLRGTLEHAMHPDEYAELILAIFTHLENKYDLVPDALEIILEADNTRTWNGKHIGQGLVAAKKRLNEAGFFPQIIAPSTANASRAIELLDGIAKVPGAIEAMDTFAYHRYDIQVTRDMVEAIAQTADQRNLSTAMLEHVEADYTELIDDLTIGNVSAWQQYGIASNQMRRKGGYYYDVKNSNSDSPQIVLDSLAKPLSLIFPHVRAGASRLAASSTQETVKPVAFVNPDNTYVLALHATAGSETFIKGLPPGEYAVSHATPNGSISRKGITRIDEGVVFPVETKTGLTVLVQTGAGLAVWEDPDRDLSGNNTDGPLGTRAGGASFVLLLILAWQWRTHNGARKAQARSLRLPWPTEYKHCNLKTFVTTRHSPEHPPAA